MKALFFSLSAWAKSQKDPLFPFRSRRPDPLKGVRQFKGPDQRPTARAPRQCYKIEERKSKFQQDRLKVFSFDLSHMCVCMYVPT
jgi:hypothetical protein